MNTSTKPRNAPATQQQNTGGERNLTVGEQRAQRRRLMVAELQRMKPQFEAALPSHITPDKFQRVALTAFNSSPELQDVEDVRSFLQACMKAAQDGLMPDNRQAALVLFKGKVQYMPMIAGVLSLAERTGKIASIAAHVAYANDQFRVVLGDDERIEHEPTLTDKGEPIAVYAICKTKDGGVYREVMTVEQVREVQAVSQTGSKADSPWGKWWGEMARKTVLRRLLKRVPASSELMDVLDRDNYQYAHAINPARDRPSAADAFAADQNAPPETLEIVDPGTGEVIEGELAGEQNGDQGGGDASGQVDLKAGDALNGDPQ